MLKKISYVLILYMIIMLVVPVVAPLMDKNNQLELYDSADAVAIVDDAMVVAIILLVSAGVIFLNSKSVQVVVEDFFNNASDYVKDKINDYKDTGVITYDEDVWIYVDNYAINAYETILNGEFIYAGENEWRLDRTGIIPQKRSPITGIDTTGIGYGKTVMIEINFPYNHYFYVKSTNGTYTGNIKVNIYWDETEQACYIATGHHTTIYEIYALNVGNYLNYPLNLKILQVPGYYATYSFNGTYKSDSNTFNIINTVIGVISTSDGFGSPENANYKVYELVDGNVNMYDPLTWDLEKLLNVDDVIMGDAGEANIDTVIDIPTGVTFEDFVNMTAADIGAIAVGTAGIYGVLLNIKALLKTIALALSTGLVGDLTKVSLPEIEMENVETRFPFSLPWDIKNAINSLAYDGEIPTFSVKVPAAQFGEISCSITIPEDFRFIISFARTALLLIFMIGLIYLTARLLGGAK